MVFSKIKDKYFVLVEGSDRAIIRASEAQAERTRERLLKYSGGRKVYVYKAEGRNG